MLHKGVLIEKSHVNWESGGRIIEAPKTDACLNLHDGSILIVYGCWFITSCNKTDLVYWDTRTRCSCEKNAVWRLSGVCDIIKHAMENIHLLTDANPIQMLLSLTVKW